MDSMIDALHGAISALIGLLQDEITQVLLIILVLEFIFILFFPPLLYLLLYFLTRSQNLLRLYDKWLLSSDSERKKDLDLTLIFYASILFSFAVSLALFNVGPFYKMFSQETIEFVNTFLITFSILVLLYAIYDMALIYFKKRRGIL